MRRFTPGRMSSLLVEIVHERIHEPLHRAEGDVPPLKNTSNGSSIDVEDFDL